MDYDLEDEGGDEVVLVGEPTFIDHSSSMAIDDR
jgi:hypothetical protein